MRDRDRPKLQDMTETVIMSMDVKALYPSISVKLATDTMIRMVKQSELPWDNIDITTLERFIAVTISKDELIQHRVSECTPAPKPRTTLNSWVNPSGTARETEGESQFVPKLRDATPKELRTMIALALAKTIETCMTNHYYSFG